MDVNDSELPRKRKLPKRFEDGNAEPEFSSDCKQHFRQQYFEAIDLTVFDIKDYILNLSSAQRALISEVCTILELILVTNAISECNAASENIP